MDDEVGRLIDEAHARARTIVVDHRQHLDRLADRLMAAETLDKDDINELLAEVPRDAVVVPEKKAPEAEAAPRRRRPNRRVLEGVRVPARS